MPKFENKTILRFQEYRSKKLLPIAQFFHPLGITANLMTSFSLLFGFLSVYYLFNSYSLFIFFALLHLFADALDGVIARSLKPTHFGEIFDFATDQLLVILLMLKIGWNFHDYYAYIVAALYFLAQLIYYLSKFETPILFTRTLTLILLSLTFIPLKILIFTIPEITYICSGVASVYSLAAQLPYLLKKNTP